MDAIKINTAGEQMRACVLDSITSQHALDFVFHPGGGGLMVIHPREHRKISIARHINEGRFPCSCC